MKVSYKNKQFDEIINMIRIARYNAIKSVNVEIIVF
jgi:hypothetical protein